MPLTLDIMLTCCAFDVKIRTEQVLEGVRDIAGAVMKLREDKVKGWPIPLKGCIDVNGKLRSPSGGEH